MVLYASLTAQLDQTSTPATLLAGSDELPRQEIAEVIKD
jgi:hypothetical protein